MRQGATYDPPAAVVQDVGPDAVKSESAIDDTTVDGDGQVEAESAECNTDEKVSETAEEAEIVEVVLSNDKTELPADQAPDTKVSRESHFMLVYVLKFYGTRLSSLSVIAFDLHLLIRQM